MWKSLFLIAVFVFGSLLSHAARAAEVYDTITSSGDRPVIQGPIIQGKENTIAAARIGCVGKLDGEQDSANSVLRQCPVSCSP